MTDDLDLGPLDLTDPMRRGDGLQPDQGDALRRRLANDSLYPSTEGGSGALYSTNALHDPTFETILRQGQVAVGTGWTPVGNQWQARIVVTSGATPSVVGRRTHSRKLMEGHLYRSDILVFDCVYADGTTGVSLVELRPKKPIPPPPHVDWPWAVVAARVYIDSKVRAWTNLDEDDADAEEDPPNFVRMGLHTGAYSGDLEEEGDETDLQELSDDRMESQVYAATETVNRDHWWVLQVGLSKSTAAGIGGVAVAVAEPQFNYSYQEAPMPYEPALSGWDGGGGSGTVPPGGGDADGCLFDSYERGADREDQGWWQGEATVWNLQESGHFSGGAPGAWSTSQLAAAGVKRVRSVSGVRRVEHTSPENTPTGCGLSGSWFGWNHKEVWWRANYGTRPANAVALAVQFNSGAARNLLTPQFYDIYVSPTLPTGPRGGTKVGTMTTSESKRFDIDVDTGEIPATGPVYIGVVPQFDAAAKFDSAWFACGFSAPQHSLSGEIDISLAQGFNGFMWVNGTIGLGALPSPPCGWWPGGNLYAIDSGGVRLAGGDMHVTGGGVYSASVASEDGKLLPMEVRDFRVTAEYTVSPSVLAATAGRRYIAWAWEDNIWRLDLGDPTNNEGVGANQDPGTDRAVPQGVRGTFLMEMHAGIVRGFVVATGVTPVPPWDSEGVALPALVAGDPNYHSWRAFGELDASQELRVHIVSMEQRPLPGDEFLQLTIADGTGLQASFLGFQTKPGTALFYVDDHLTEPIAYDDETGIVQFDRSPSIGAVIKQTGTAA